MQKHPTDDRLAKFNRGKTCHDSRLRGITRENTGPATTTKERVLFRRSRARGRFDYGDARGRVRLHTCQWAWATNVFGRRSFTIWDTDHPTRPPSRREARICSLYESSFSRERPAEIHRNAARESLAGIGVRSGLHESTPDTSPRQRTGLGPNLWFRSRREAPMV